MTHHRNFGFDEARNQFEAALAAFDFHGFCAGFLHEANGVLNGFVDRNVEAAEGHIGNEQRAFRAAADGARVMKNLIERDGQRAVVAESDHAQRIADEQHVDAGLVEQARGGIVVGCEKRDLFCCGGAGKDTCGRECQAR